MLMTTTLMHATIRMCTANVSDCKAAIKHTNRCACEMFAYGHEKLREHNRKKTQTLTGNMKDKHSFYLNRNLSYYKIIKIVQKEDKGA